MLIISESEPLNLTNCDREPIHIPGSIQPHGLLLTLNLDDFSVLQIAGNVEDILGLKEENLRENGFGRFITHATKIKIEAAAEQQAHLLRPLFVYDIISSPQGDFEAVFHSYGKLLLAELVAKSKGNSEAPLILVQSMLTSLEAHSALQNFLQDVADKVRHVSEFDRVMIYQFQPDDSGHVIAESRGNNIESYLDLHYPASDIPVQARALYLSNWIRLIPDTLYQAAPLRPVLIPGTNQPVDLSHSVLRSVSPIHLEYLANMGVRASMSLSLIVDGKLWGLVACHNYQPLFLSHTKRGVCELFAQLASLQLAEKLATDDRTQRLNIKTDHSTLVESLLKTGDLKEGLILNRTEFLKIIPGDGLAIWWEGNDFTLGVTPNQRQLKELVEWLNQTMKEGIFYTDNLSKHYPGALAYSEKVSGLMALSISRSPNDYILWFRGEQIKTVTWAGDPNKPMKSGPNGERLNPRESFAAWRDTVRHTSKPWTLVSVEAATALRISILEVVLRHIDQTAREREKAKIHQDFLMAELDHRVKNSLSTIQSLVWHSSKSAKDLTQFTTSLQQRLQSMARAHSLLTNSRWVGADLRQIVEDELNPFRDNDGIAHFSVHGPKVAIRPKAALAISLALHELATNAAKYGGLSTDKGRVSVEWHVEPDKKGELHLTLEWQERGGPMVKPPERKGFGRTLLEKTLAFDLDGVTKLEFLPEGVTCTATIPFNQLIETGEALQSTALKNEPSAQISLKGLRILLVEDAALIAIQTQSIMEDQGITVIGPALRIEQALSLIEENELDCALLDVDLQGEVSWPIAQTLADKKTPFIFCTGFAPATIPERFRNTPTLNKPYSDDQMIGMIKTVMANQAK